MRPPSPPPQTSKKGAGILNDTDFVELLMNLQRGEWEPPAGSLGAALAADAGDPRCRAERERHLHQMALQGFESEGWWWLVTLQAPIGDVDDGEVAWVLTVWDGLASGRWRWRTGDGSQ